MTTAMDQIEYQDECDHKPNKEGDDGSLAKMNEQKKAELVEIGSNSCASVQAAPSKLLFRRSHSSSYTTSWRLILYARPTGSHHNRKVLTLKTPQYVLFPNHKALICCTLAMSDYRDGIRLTGLWLRLLGLPLYSKGSRSCLVSPPPQALSCQPN